MRTFLTNAVFCILVCGGLILPGWVRAATVYFDVPNSDIYVGDTFVVDVVLSSPDKIINVADGYIEFDKDILEVKDLSRGGSIFSVWAKNPEFSNSDGRIDFIGGVPGGFTNGEGEIFKIIFYAKAPGTANLDFNDNFLLFQNDGLGTKLGLWLGPRSVTVLEHPEGVAIKDEWQEILAQDKVPPEDFDIIIARDPLAFDNQYFIIFHTNDRESGIDYYEVKEGEGDFVRAQSPYVLKNQELDGTIQVRAVDEAGNERIAEVKLAKSQLRYTPFAWAAGGVLLLILLYIVFQKYTRKR